MKNEDQPAYPSVKNFIQMQGFTKREAMAMAAMQGILASSWGKKDDPEKPGKSLLMLDQITEGAIKSADALLKALEE